MKGKEKCKALKEIRRQIAKANDIALAVSECKHQGDCLGTCPKCESELRYLERELALRQNLGKAVAVVGLSTGVCASMTACGPLDDAIDNLFNGTNFPGAVETLEGDIAVPEETGPLNLNQDNQYDGTSEPGCSSEEVLVGEVVSPEMEVEGLMVAPKESETTIELMGDIAYPEGEMGPYEENPVQSSENDTDWEIAGALPEAN